METQNHCYDCVYSNLVPGSSHHQECMRDFKGIKTPELNSHGIKNGWCLWPINFDPIWVGKCDGFSKEKLHVRNSVDGFLELFKYLH